MLSRGLPPRFLADSSPLRKLPSRNRPDNDERLLPRRHRVRQRGIRRLVRQILLAGEEPQERPALLPDLVADPPPQHRIAGLNRVEDRAKRYRAVDVEFHLATAVPRRSEAVP